MTFSYVNSQSSIIGGKKTTRRVIIKNAKGYKSLCTYKNGKKCHNKKKHLRNLEIKMIKMGKFIPNLFSDIKRKSRKNK